MPNYFPALVQGTPEWFAARCGLLTASEMKLIITPAKLQYAQNDKERSHLYELAAQRITGYVEPSYVSDDMLRGERDEIAARQAYSKNYAPVQEMGFVTNDRWGFVLGYSPDGLVGDDGQIEGKSRRMKYQIETIVSDEMPTEYSIQVQTGLLVTNRKWCDFISYSGIPADSEEDIKKPTLPMMTKRIYADVKVQNAIIEAATIFHDKLDKFVAEYQARLKSPNARLIPVERRIEQEIML